MKAFINLAAAALLTVIANPAAAEFAADQYHDNNCTRCHDSSVYTRENRRVQSYPMLETQVARCDAMLETKLFPDDLALLVDHLNDNYYKYSK